MIILLMNSYTYWKHELDIIGMIMMIFIDNTKVIAKIAWKKGIFL